LTEIACVQFFLLQLDVSLLLVDRHLLHSTLSHVRWVFARQRDEEEFHPEIGRSVNFIDWLINHLKLDE